MICFNCSLTLKAQTKDLYYCSACPTHFTIQSHASILERYYLQYNKDWILTGSRQSNQTIILLPKSNTPNYSPWITIPFLSLSLSTYGQEAINLCNQYLPLKAFS